MQNQETSSWTKVEVCKREAKRTQIEILELKNTITVLKISLDSFNSRLNQIEETNLKKRSFEIIKSEEQKSKDK